MKARRNITIILFCLVAATATANAKIVNDSLYEISKTKIPPVIDGIQDAVWKTLDWNFQRTYTVGDPPAPTDSGANLSGMSKAMWDVDNIYLLFYTIDDSIVDIPANAIWNQDAIEIYIDADNSKTPDGVMPDPGPGIAPIGDWQFTIPHMVKDAEATHHYLCFGTTLDSTGIEYKIRDVSQTEGFPGFMVEIKIPLANLGIDPAAGTTIGFELQQDESDDPMAGRKGISKWWHYSNYSWTNAALWGTAVLNDRVVDTVLEINKRPTSDSIIVDGEMDPAYKFANPVSMNVFRVDGLGNVNDAISDAFLTVYPLWDEMNLYFFFDIVDDDIQEIPANPVWDQDGIEIYFDPNNSKTPDGVSPDPGGGVGPNDYQITVPHWIKGHEEDTAWGACFFSYCEPYWFEFVKFKIMDKPENGYSVEVKWSLSNRGIVVAPGDRIGLEFQLDESDSTDGGHRGSILKWWYPSNSSWTDASIWGTAQLSGLIVNVKEQPIATNFHLAQNYPNPFNPVTSIKYEVPNTDVITIKIFDMLGREVATFVNAQKQPGKYEVQWDASNNSSGVYFYRIQARNFAETKKMILLK